MGHFNFFKHLVLMNKIEQEIENFHSSTCKNFSEWNRHIVGTRLIKKKVLVNLTNYLEQEMIHGTLLSQQ